MTRTIHARSMMAIVAIWLTSNVVVVAAEKHRPTRIAQDTSTDTVKGSTDTTKGSGSSGSTNSGGSGGGK